MVLLKYLLEEERRRVSGLDEDERDKLRKFIKTRDTELSDESVLNELFEEYLTTIPISRHPGTIVQKYRLYTQWEGNLRTDLANKRNELEELENQPVDKHTIVKSAQDRLLSLLDHEAEALGLLPYSGRTTTDAKTMSNTNVISSLPLPSVGWIPLTDTKLNPTGKTPALLKFPSGKEVAVNSWSSSLVEAANLLIREGKLSSRDCPIPSGQTRKAKTYLINTTPYHSDGRPFTGKRDLLHGMVINTNFNSKNIIIQSKNLLLQFGEDPSQFHIRLQQ